DSKSQTQSRMESELLPMIGRIADLPDVFDAYGGHKEGASALPSDLVCLAYSADCPVQAFRVGDNVYATQFHPELDADGISTRIDVYKDYGYFAPETAESLKSA